MDVVSADVLIRGGEVTHTIEGKRETEDIHYDLPGVQLGVLGIEFVQWFANYDLRECACLRRERVAYQPESKQRGTVSKRRYGRCSGICG